MANAVLSSLGKQTGLFYNKNYPVLCGVYQGHMVSIVQGVVNAPASFQFSVKESASTPPLAFENYAPALKAAVREVQSVTRSGNKIVVVLGNSFAWKSTLKNTRLVLDSIVGFLSANFYVDCCESCGAEFGTGVYAVNGSAAHYCEGCYQTALASLEMNRQQIKEKKGNIPAGLVGALIGSLIGVVVFVLINQLGYIAAISGFIMAICAVKGYEMLGGKVNLVGTIGTCIIMVVMVLFAENINVTLEIMGELGMGMDIGAFFQIFRAIPAFMNEGMIDMPVYIGGLVMAYFLTALGAVPTILAQYRAKNGSYQVQRLA